MIGIIIVVLLILGSIVGYQAYKKWLVNEYGDDISRKQCYDESDKEYEERVDKAKAELKEMMKWAKIYGSIGVK